MISDTNTPRYSHHRQDTECFHDPKLSLVLFPASLIQARQPVICWSPEIRSIFQDFIKVRSCFHLCLTSLVCHSVISVVAFCLFLNFLNSFLIIFRSFPEKEMSPFFITFIKNIWIHFIFLCCLWHSYFQILLIWLLWVSVVVCGMWFPDQESNLGSLVWECRVIARGTAGNSGYSYFCWSLFFFFKLFYNHSTMLIPLCCTIK